MALKVGTLRVCTNPYRVVDDEQRPCCVVPVDPHDPRFPKDVRGWRGYVGSKIVSSELIRKGNEQQGGLRADRHDRVWGFEHGTIELPDTTYYRRIVADGDLIPADEATAATCRVRFRFVDEVRAETQTANAALDAVWLEPDGD